MLAASTLGVAFWLAAGLAVAQQPPLPIRIESDRAELSQREGQSIYSGDVVLTRGGLTLTGSRLVIARINDRGNIRAVLSGSPATLDKQPDREGNDVVTGDAQRIEYTNADSTLVLRGNAVVRRGGDEVQGEVIRHNLDTERTEAGGGDNRGDGRVRITIQPPAGNDGS